MMKYFGVFLDISDEGKAFVGTVCASAALLLKDQLLYQYTDHTVDHSFRVEEYISKLLQGSNIALSDNEKIILLCAILLHDVGMQTTKYLKDFDAGQPLGPAQIEEIRQRHHRYSGNLIVESVTLELSERYYLGLDGRKDIVDFIANVSMFHRSLDISTLQDSVLGGGTIRACLH